MTDGAAPLKDNFTDPEHDPRVDAPPVSGEKETLLGFLAFQRDTFVLKCSGLSPEQLAERAVPPSNLSLLGLIRHLSDVERAWFRGVMAREGRVKRFVRAGDHDFAFTAAEPTVDCVEGAKRLWREEVAYTDRFIAEAESLDVTGWERWRGEVSLRWVLIHMIEEYARHNGHADLLRERIDGVTGQ